MLDSAPKLHVCIVGSRDFVRRMASASRQTTSSGKSMEISVITGNLAEAKSLVLSHRPQILVGDIGFRTSRRDMFWLRNLLSELKSRFHKNLYVILAVPRPEKFVFAGTLLFASDATLSPSGLIDNLIIAPPPGMPSIPALEEQLQDCYRCIAEVLMQNPEGLGMLPALWEESWVPAMCDPESRLVWMRWLPRYAQYTNENPLIFGPTGSGKTRLAAALHALSGRPGPFVSITPRDFSSTELVQAELFGAAAGAYTGAVDKWGLVKKADKGTLFIDELQSIDIDLQGKLITFIENKTYRRVGEAESHQADVRFVFASNRTLQELVDQGRLRDDFAYRLERLQLTLKPLILRRLDIAAGLCFALPKVLRERAQTKTRSSSRDHASSEPLLEGLSLGAYRLLFGSSWPGNLRQLENTTAKLIELSSIKGKHLIDEECVGEALQGLLGQTDITSSDIFGQAAQAMVQQSQSSGFESLRDCAESFKDYARISALEHAGGETNKAATLIGDSPKIMELFAAARTSS